jgi:hypothetical protein
MGEPEKSAKAELTEQGRFVRRVRHRWIAARCFLGLLGVLLPCTLLGMLLFGANLGGLAQVGSGWAYFGAALVSGFVLPVIMCLPILLPWASRWHEPRRIIAFRRFHIAENRKLSKLLTRYLAPYGHVFTLADTRIHLSWTVRIPLFLGQLSFIHFRPRTVRDEGRLRVLVRLLEHRVRLNVNWLVSYGKLFAIRSSDEYWRACVDSLLKRSDLVLADISHPSDALEWELSQCIERMPDRTILLAVEDQQEIVESWMGSGGQLHAALRTLPLFVHGKGRVADEETFRSLIAERLVATRYPSPPSPFLRTFLSFAGNLSSSLAVAIATVLVVTPFYLPSLTVRYSPFWWQVEEVYYGEKTLADRALARLDSMDHKAAVESINSHARSGTIIQWTSMDALAKIGDRSSVAPLWEIACSNQPYARKHASDVLKQLSARLGSGFVDESLSVLRNGRPGLNAWGAPLFRDLLARVPRPEFEPLLRSHVATARFTAALRLAPEMDPRTVPVLLEMMRHRITDRSFSWTQFRTVQETAVPLLNDAKTLADQFAQHPEVPIEAEGLRPYLTGSDQAAFSAAWLAFTHGLDRDLQGVLQTADGSDGFAALSVLAEGAKERGQPAAVRAAALLKVGRRSVVDTMLAAGDPLTSARASVVLAVRGDARAVPLALEASRVVETEWLVIKTYPHEQMAHAAIDYLYDDIMDPRTLPKPLARTGEIPIWLFAPLIRLYGRARDDETAKALIATFVRRPDATSWFNQEDKNVGAVVPPRLDSWFLAQGLAETDPQRIKAYTSVYGWMVRKQRNDNCAPDAIEGTLTQWAGACPLPAR